MSSRINTNILLDLFKSDFFRDKIFLKPWKAAYHVELTGQTFTEAEEGT